LKKQSIRFNSCHLMAGKLNLILLWTVLLSSNAARVARHNSTRAAGRVSHMFTFGAPHPSNPMLTTQSGGCFNGYRVTAWDDDLFVDDEDIVPTLLVASSYNHPNVRTLAVVNKGNGVQSTWSCGKNPIRFTNPKVSLHDKGGYMRNMDRLESSYWRAKEASAVGLKNSYEGNLGTVRSNVAAEGWNLVGTSESGEDVSHLFQDPSSLRCILTFEGSDSFGDFVADAEIIRVPFCGLPMKAHTGFKKELLRMVGSRSWQSNVRPKLSKCSSVDVVGHSLGGATASLFAACVDFQNGSEEYNKMSWSVESPRKMSAV